MLQIGHSRLQCPVLALHDILRIAMESISECSPSATEKVDAITLPSKGFRDVRFIEGGTFGR